MDVIKTRVPLHVASIEMQKLIPLKNGINNYHQIFETFTSNEAPHILISKIIKHISFGIYEKFLMEEKFDDVKVNTIMGSQSSGKSHILNRFFGTRFNVNVNRCTDGLWMGFSFANIGEKQVCYIVIDCEGLFNIRRRLDEEIRLVLAATSISDVTIFNTTNNSDDRNFLGFFERLHSLFKKLKGKNLFKGFLFILIRDLADDKLEMKNFYDDY